MILETSPSPDFWMIDFNSSWVILPNPLGIHNAGYSYSAYEDDDGGAVIDNDWFGVIVIYLLNVINFLHPFSFKTPIVGEFLLLILHFFLFYRL